MIKSESEDSTGNYGYYFCVTNTKAMYNKHQRLITKCYVVLKLLCLYLFLPIGTADNIQ